MTIDRINTQQAAEELAASKMQEMLEAMLAEGAEIEESDTTDLPMFAY